MTDPKTPHPCAALDCDALTTKKTYCTGRCSERQRRRDKGIPARRKPAPAPCPQCDKILSSPAALRNHLKTIHDPDRPPRTKQPTYCEPCGKGFSNGASLKAHQERKHNPADEPPRLADYIPPAHDEVRYGSGGLVDYYANGQIVGRNRALVGRFTAQNSSLKEEE